MTTENTHVVGFDHVIFELEHTSPYEFEPILLAAVKYARENPKASDEDIIAHCMGYKWGELNGRTGYVGEGDGIDRLED